MASILHPKPSVRRDFPLSWHKGSGQWFKKFRGKFVYFGSDPIEALSRYMETKDYHIAGVSVPSEETLTVRSLCNQFIKQKDRDKDAGTITRRTYAEYHEICQAIVTQWDLRAVKTLRPLDFADLRHALGTGSPNVLRRKIVIVRSVFKFGFAAGLISTPVRYGESFDLPSKTESRKHRAKQTKPVFDGALIRQMLFEAGPQLRACVLLGINCGFYAKDCADLRTRHIEGEFISFAREKTGIERRVWLWPETRAAIAEAKAEENKEGRVFLSKTGLPLYRDHGKTRSDLVTSQFHFLKQRMELKRENSGFKCFRHTYRTVADGCGDQPAIGLTMGHTDSHVADHYRHGISDDRLIVVAKYVHQWLFSTATEESSDVR